MLFLGLGTGMGSAMILDGVLEPMELGHLPYRRNKTFEDYVGAEGLRRLGRKKWRGHVADVVKRLTDALQPDYVVLGGGNAGKLGKLPPKARRGTNADAFKGGFRLWAKRGPKRGPKRGTNAREIGHPRCRCGHPGYVCYNLQSALPLAKIETPMRVLQPGASSPNLSMNAAYTSEIVGPTT